MKKIKISIAVLGLAMLASCGKNYDCKCTGNKMVSQTYKALVSKSEVISFVTEANIEAQVEIELNAKSGDSESSVTMYEATSKSNAAGSCSAKETSTSVETEDYGSTKDAYTVTTVYESTCTLEKGAK